MSLGGHEPREEVGRDLALVKAHWLATAGLTDPPEEVLRGHRRVGVPELLDSLHTFTREQPDHVISFPPRFEVVPCKPLLFDVARNAIRYPDLRKDARVELVATYLDRDILQSGWLLGEERIANKAAVVSVKQGDGSIVMLGFRAQHRAQTHGTFKLLFNALLNRGDAVGEIAAGGG